jgi:ubiquitin
MKDKIIAAIKAKFPAINLSKKRLNAIAAVIEKKVIDDETKIDATLDDLNSFTPLSELAKQDDEVRTLEAKIKSAQLPKDKDDVEATPVPGDDAPAYVKTLVEGLNKLTTQVQQLQSERAQTTVRQQIADKLKDVPASYWGKRAIPEKQEGVENFITEVTADYMQFKQELTDQGLAVLSTPRSAQQTDTGKEKAVNPEVKKFAESQARQNAASAVAAK